MIANHVFACAYIGLEGVYAWYIIDESRCYYFRSDHQPSPKGRLRPVPFCKNRRMIWYAVTVTGRVTIWGQNVRHPIRF